MLGRSLGRLLAAVPSAAALFVATPSPARAGEPTLVTRELGTWDEALEVLRGDLHSEGRRIHVGVRAGGDLVPCDRYRLELDEAAAAAFHLGGCDPGTRETLLVLEHRAALFDEGYHVPRPRTLSVTAVLRATAVGGGEPRGGSIVHCTWDVRPYLDDVEHGTRVMLTPEHYALRSAAASVTPLPDRSGWALAASGAVFNLEYEVEDLGSHDVVLRQKTRLTCGEAATADPPQPDEPQAPPHAGAPDWLVRMYGTLPPPRPAGAPAFVAAAGPANANGCRWGTGRKGCSGSPLGAALGLTMIGASLGIGAAAAFTGGFRSTTATDSELRPLGVGALILGGLASGSGAYAWYLYATPPGEAKRGVAPVVSFSGRDAALGVQGTF